LGCLFTSVAVAKVLTLGTFKNVYYVNGTVLNKKAAVKAAVKDRVRDKLGGKHTYGLGHVVNRIITDDQFTEKLALQIADGAPAEMQLKANLAVDAEVCFSTGCYFVVKISMHRIDIVNYIQQLKKLEATDRKLRCLQLFLDTIGESAKVWLEKCFTELVTRKVASKIGASMKANLWRKAKVDVDVQGVLPSDQASFLFNKLSQIVKSAGCDDCDAIKTPKGQEYVALQKRYKRG